MRALTWHGTNDVRVDTVSDPEIINPRDAIIKITSTAQYVSPLMSSPLTPGAQPPLSLRQGSRNIFGRRHPYKADLFARYRGVLHNHLGAVQNPWLGAGQIPMIIHKRLHLLL